MPKGSVLVWHGSLWHGGGANATDDDRIGIAMNYCAGWIRQQENQQLGIPRDVARTFSPRLRELVGYGVYNMLDRPHQQAQPGRDPRRARPDPTRDGVGPTLTPSARRGSRQQRAIFAAFLANLGIAIAKFAAVR